MNKSKFSIFIIIIFVVFLLLSCGKNQEETLIKEFLTEFYTVESREDFDKLDYALTYLESEKVKKIKSYLTEEAFKPIAANRTHYLYVVAANHKGIDIGVSNINIEEYRENEEGKVYNYKVKLSFKEGKESEEYTVSGQLTVAEVEGEITITHVNKLRIPDRIHYIFKEMSSPIKD